MMEFLEWLELRVQHPLPGRTAHQRFVPNLKDAERRLEPAPTTAKQSAVLVPLISGNEELEVLFTVRSESLRSHKGQISFPGGRIDEGETAIEAALRETHEEVGIDRTTVRVLGMLSPLYIPPSNSAVTPIVGHVQHPTEWTLSTDEVNEVFTRPLADFLNDDNFVLREGIIPQLPIRVPTWDVHHTIPLWGATAMMLHEVVVLYQEFLREQP